MSLRDAAMKAREEAVASVVTAAHDHLTALLQPPDPADLAALVEVDVDEAPTYELVVFSDGDVTLAVRHRKGGGSQEWSVHIVSGDPAGGWTEHGPPVTSLAQLGDLLPEHDPPEAPESEYAAWVQPTGAHDAYALGARVAHVGKVWESLIDANVYEPGVSSWREVV